MNKKRRLRPPLIILAATLLLSVLIVPGLYSGLLTVRYEIEADGIEAPVKIALITDLHSCKYGERETELINAVNAESPDIVVLVGDIFDDELPDTNTEYFLRAISEKYDCYYVTGNHEYWSGAERFAEKMAIIDECGIRRLSGELVTVTANGQNFNICGVDDPDAYMVTGGGNYVSFADQLSRVRELSDNGSYTVLLSHRPESIGLYAHHGFDLVLSGHAHGGQWRIPFILNGLWAPDQGLFPAYAGGRYEDGITTMIVSRGLARESTRVPRFYNRPELVVVTIK